jgi:hypothetical protein
MQKFDAAIIVDVRRSRETWCVFEHQAVLKQGEPPETILIGACRLQDVYSLTDGKTNSEWQNMFLQGGQVLVRIVATSLNRADAFRVAGEHVRDTKPTPRCNLKGYNLRGQRRPVICLNNGKRYETQLDAASELGIHASAISRMLRGNASTAQGYKFAYAGDTRPEDVVGLGA